MVAQLQQQWVRYQLAPLHSQPPCAFELCWLVQEQTQV